MSTAFYSTSELRPGARLVALKDVKIDVDLHGARGWIAESARHRVLHAGEEVVFLGRDRGDTLSSPATVRLRLHDGTRATVSVGPFHLRRDEFRRA